jgi:hypothetical protein
MQTPSANLRPASITVASILSALLGILAVISGLVLLAIGNLASSVPFFGIYLSEVVSMTGIVSLSVGVLRLLAGVWLWNLQVKGGVLSVIIVVIVFVISGVSLLLGNSLAIIDLALDILVLVLVVLGWHALR